MPQTQAPYYTITLDKNGEKSQENDMDIESWAMIDVGFYTTVMAMEESEYPNP